MYVCMYCTFFFLLLVLLLSKSPSGTSSSVSFVVCTIYCTLYPYINSGWCEKERFPSPIFYTRVRVNTDHLSNCLNKKRFFPSQCLKAECEIWWLCDFSTKKSKEEILILFLRVRLNNNNRSWAEKSKQASIISPSRARRPLALVRHGRGRPHPCLYLPTYLPTSWLLRRPAIIRVGLKWAWHDDARQLRGMIKYVFGSSLIFFLFPAFH